MLILLMTLTGLAQELVLLYFKNSTILKKKSQILKVVVFKNINIEATPHVFEASQAFILCKSIISSLFFGCAALNPLVKRW